MSTPILPYLPAEPGATQVATQYNDVAIRLEILTGLVISDSTTAQPGSPTSGDIYIIPASATGAQWSTFDEFDLVIFKSGTWYPFAPVEGIVVNLAGALKQWDGSAYVNPGGAGGVDWGDIAGTLTDQTDLVAALALKSARGVSIVTEASTSTMTPATHAGLDRYVRAAGNVTFNTSQSYTAGEVYNIRATASISLAGTGVTLTPPAGGTLDMDAYMSVTVVMTSSSAGDVIGQTVPA